MRKQHVRMQPAERRAQLLQAGVAIATAKYDELSQHSPVLPILTLREYAIASVTRSAVAQATETTDGLVTRYFGCVEGLRRAVREAWPTDGSCVV